MSEPFSMKAFPPGLLPESPAGRVEFVTRLLQGVPLVDDDGEPTGEWSGPLIDEETARRLLAVKEPNT